jgi:uncharacterized Fe-S cluster-containing radical SAM superfamily protein
MIDLPFNPLQRVKEVEELVLRSPAKKYFRFRPARYYGGIAMPDLMGCPFLFAYCWNYKRNMNPERSGDTHYAPKEVARRLVRIMKRKGYNRARLSGAEQILDEQSFNHLYQTLKEMFEANPTADFTLETNGLFLDCETGFVRRLSQFKNLHAGVALEGSDKESFVGISGAEARFFDLPLGTCGI